MTHHGPFLPGAGEIVFAVFSILGTIVAALVVIAVLVVLVRFLLVATKAAQFYVADHAKTTPTSPAPAPTPLVTHPTPDPAPDEPIVPPAAPSDLDEATVIAPSRKRTAPPAPPSV